MYIFSKGGTLYVTGASSLSIKYIGVGERIHSYILSLCWVTQV